MTRDDTNGDVDDDGDGDVDDGIDDCDWWEHFTCGVCSVMTKGENVLCCYRLNWDREFGGDPQPSRRLVDRGVRSGGGGGHHSLVRRMKRWKERKMKQRRNEELKSKTEGKKRKEN